MSLRRNHAAIMSNAKLRAYTLIVLGLLLLCGGTFFIRHQIVSDLAAVKQKRTNLVMEQKSKQMELDKVNHYNNVNEAKGNNKYILKAINDLQELKILKLGVSKINYANQAFVVYVSNRKFVKQNIQQSIHCWEMKEDELLSFVYLC